MTVTWIKSDQPTIRTKVSAGDAGFWDLWYMRLYNGAVTQTRHLDDDTNEITAVFPSMSRALDYVAAWERICK